VTDAHVPYRRLIGFGLAILLVAAIADVVIEYGPATAALQNWVCAGSSVCQGAYLLLWFSGRYPFYATSAAIAALLIEMLRIAARYFRSQLAPAVARTELFRWVVLVVAVAAVAQLVACTGQTTCALSKSCI
jgi:hypothetical protein